MKGMAVVIRCDASVRIGSGHVMRCLSLAEALRADGVASTFMCRSQQGDLCILIEARGFQVIRLRGEYPGSGQKPGQDEQSPQSVSDDARETVAAIAELPDRPQWLVVDHYGLDQAWERMLRNVVERILVIDDRANRVHDCDLLLDQNLVPQMLSRYRGKVPASCSLLLGPKYALLQSVYAGLHDRVPEREGAVARILVFFSGADVENLTGAVISGLLQMNRPDIKIDAVISGVNTHLAEIRSQISGHGHMVLHVDLPSLAPLLVQADLAIGAAGTTTWERLCLGLPALVVTLSENQEPVAEYLHELGLVDWLGRSSEIGVAKILAAVSRVVAEGLAADWSRRCAATVDGRGAARVSSILATNVQSPLTVRYATVHDEELLLDLANDPVTRRNALSTDPIGADEHRQWFRRRLRAIESTRIYVVESGAGVPVGQVRFDLIAGEWVIDYSVASHFRGRRLGVRLLGVVLDQIRHELTGARLCARVKQENVASRRVFEHLGFDFRPEGDLLEFRCVL